MYLNSLAFKQGSTKHTYCGWVGEAVKLYRGGLRDPGAPESYEVVYVLPIIILTGSLCRKGRYLLQGSGILKVGMSLIKVCEGGGKFVV